MILPNSGKQWFNVALANFGLAALAGVALRLAFVTEIPWLNYRNLLHGHSHTALIGWVYLALFALLMANWPVAAERQKIFRNLFVLNELSVIGMFITFPIYGYKAVPIAFTSLHLFLSYFFIYYFLREVRIKGPNSQNSIKFITASLFFQAFSTLGIWILPIIISQGGRHSSLYHMAVQFFLHFQFNGWFLFAILGLFFKTLERNQIQLDARNLIIFFRLLIMATFLTYALAVTWTQPIKLLFWINSLGVFIQFLALGYFMRIIWEQKEKITEFLKDRGGLLIYISGISFALKIIIQTIIILPAIAIIGYTIRNFIIGFIHLILLGVISCYLLGEATQREWLDLSTKKMQWGVNLFLSGILLTEGLLFLQGLGLWLGMGFLPGYYVFLSGFSVLLFLGVAIIWIGNFQTLADQHWQEVNT